MASPTIFSDKKRSPGTDTTVPGVVDHYARGTYGGYSDIEGHNTVRGNEWEVYGRARFITIGSI